MAKTVVISQSNYIPWKGYFDLINSADDFVVYDEVQYTRRDWRNRNRIKTADGASWLTVPVLSKGKFSQRIDEVEIEGESWREHHWKQLIHAYSQAKCFGEFREPVGTLYESAAGRLSDMNECFLRGLSELLEIRTRFHRSTDFPAREPFERTGRLVEICRTLGATEYLTGPAARAYLDEPRFAAAGIAVTYFDYSGYPEYRQLHGTFVHELSILDLLFNEGTAARRFMKSFPREGALLHANG